MSKCIKSILHVGNYLDSSISHIALIISLFLIFSSGCSVQKNTRLSRSYHNITAKYNVLFNGKESFKKGVNQIEAGFEDDFSEILPIFPFLEKDAVGLASTDMDRTIKKCSKLISLHSITVKPKVRDTKNLTPNQRAFFSKKEYNLFVDDAYLLMGKAHFYKQEYDQATEIFRLLINDFKNQPVVYETHVWLSRLLIQTGQNKDAYEILTLLQNSADFPDNLTDELYPTIAYYYLRQKDYIKSISFLENALRAERRKKTRTRYLYILAQLYEKTGDLKRASDNYAQVVKLNPVYEMAFNARINRALAYEQGFGQVEDIESELNKMLRDDKNIDFQDQIYYALGNLSTKEGNDEKALEYYQKSIQVNTDNDQQKIRSYLTLANYYYAIPDYPHAQAYYDSTVTLIEPDYPGYELLSTKSRSLNRLVTEINTVTLADSVLILAKLPKEELDARIDAMIVTERKKEELARQKLQEEQLDQQFGSETAMQSYRRQQTTAEGANWYFYNDAAKSLGYREFKVEWGTRKLEDHWQRSVKAIIGFAAGSSDENESETRDSAAVQLTLSKLSREYYLANIPFTDSAVMATLKNVELALYNMGLIYKNDLKDFDRAAESFKSLIRRYPESSYLLASYYNLYSIAKDQNNQALIDYYKNIITGQYSQSMYAKVLSDPEYFKELEAKDQIVRRYYEQTYELYKSGKYTEVITRTDYALNNYPESSLVPQFEYLGTLAKGTNSDRKIFRDYLTALVTKYHGTEVAADAQNIIDYMDKEHPEMKEAEEILISKKLYTPSADSPHVFAYVLNKKINTNQLVFNIINFNLDHYDELNLLVEITDLNTTQNLIIIKPFHNQSDAMQYLKTIQSSDVILIDMPEISLLPFVVSESNLNTLKEDKSVDRYLKFFNEYYP
jgi:tetratricopeptide (TPR) repeat protein